MEGKPDSINREIFRTYDIRGIYPSQLDEYAASRIGKAYGSYIGDNKKIVVGMDIRTSSESLSKKLITSLRQMGSNITFIGVVPTPVHAFALYKYGFDGGITVSASHNPPEWNGFKMYGANAEIIGAGSGMEKIRDLVYSDLDDSSEEKGSYTTKDVLKDYEAYVLGKVSIKKSLKMGIDPGNGAYAELATRILGKTQLKVHAINDVRDGTFPSRSPEPKPETIQALIRMVKQDALNFGVAYDGDGDRAVFVDNEGNHVPSDIILCLLAKAFAKKGDRVIYELSCSDAVEETVKAKGATPVMTKVGRLYMQREMANDSSIFGGELSGHLYFKEIYGVDDAFFASLKIAEILSNTGKSLSELVSELPQYKRHVQEIKVEEKAKLKTIDILREKVRSEGKMVDLDGVKLYTGDGWFLVRASNTGPMLRLIAESKDADRLERLLKFALERISASIAEAEE